MKLAVHASKHNPVSVEEIMLENVASFSVDDNQMIIKFNGEPDLIIPLTNSPENHIGEWFGLSLVATKVALNMKLGEQ